MSSVTLHIILLLAVAYSQIFGGVSCCCLSRSILVGSYSSSEYPPSSEQGPASTNAPSVPKCPRCAASKSSVAKSFDANGSPATSIAAGSECQCAKASSHAALQLEPRAPSVTVHFIALPPATWDLVPVEEQKAWQRHEVPFRFGGNSWQSMACVWKK